MTLAKQAPRPDLDAYFKRIHYDGPRTPNLETLRSLHALHPAAIAFEAIDVLLDRGISLDPATVENKLVAAGRGGYCYEHNGLFKRVLTALGFEVEGLAARVRWMAPVDAPLRPRTHMALRVTVEGRPWLVDVGFGGAVLTAPLRLDQNTAQATQHETFRVQPLSNDLILEAWLGDTWAPLYQLSREPQLDIDYELANWYTATHPDSHFRHRLMVARTTAKARYTLLRNRLTIRQSNGHKERHILSADDIEHHLSNTFRLPTEADWRPVIERAATA